MKASRKNLIYLTVFALAAALMAMLFYRGMSSASLLSAGEHEEGVFFRGGMTQYPQAAEYAWGLYIVSLVFLGAAGWWIIRTKAGIEKIFLGIAIPLGILYIFMMVPMAGPDEQSHYQNSYQLSNALLLRWDRMNQGTADHFDYHGLHGHYNTASGYDRIVREFFQPMVDTTEKAIRQYSQNWPLMFLPQAIGIAVGRLFGLGFLPLFYLGRLMNLLFYVFCVYRAIRIMPRYRMLLCMTALLPMCMHQAASYSYDAYINGLSFLLTAKILKASWDPDPAEAGESLLKGWKRGKLKGLRDSWRTGVGGAGTISKAELGMLLLTALLWAPAKPVYTPLLLLLLIIPKERFGGMKQKLICIGTIIAVVLAEALIIQLGAVQSVAASGSSAGDGLNWQGEKNYTLSWILGHPAEAVRVVLYSIRIQYRPWLYECLGSYMAGLTILLPVRYMKIYIVLLLICVLRRSREASGDRSLTSLAEDEFRIPGWNRILCLGAAAMAAGLILLTMMLAWTSDTSELIQGIQGRYFLPLVMLPLICLDNRILILRRNPDKAVLIAGLAMHVMTIAGVLQATMTV